MAALLFKVLTQSLQTPTVNYVGVLPEVANIPAEPQPQEISHRKALYLQGSAYHRVPAVHGSIYTCCPCLRHIYCSETLILLIQRTLPCIGVLCYVHTYVCPSTCYLVCPLWYWYTVDSVLCALVGFLHGLCDARLPDTYTWLGCGIRPHVLSTQKVLDPFSPFLLALPPTLPPMWSTSSPEGGRDVVHGNLIPAGQRTGLLQCSRCEQPLHTHASCAVVALCWLQEDCCACALCKWLPKCMLYSV